IVAVNRRAHIRRHVECVDDVLDTERNARERSLCAATVDCARLIEPNLRIDERPGLDLLVARFDAVETSAGNGFPRELARGNSARNFAGRQFVEAFPRHYPLAALPAAVPAILPNTEPDVSPVPPG